MIRLLATIFSWVGGVVTTLLEVLFLSSGIDLPEGKEYCNGLGICSNHVTFEPWVWFLWFILFCIRVMVLFWRHNALENEKKIGCGICTILFASIPGGILTLCIPEDQLG